MTDSMKFGPEWLRNLSTDSSFSVGGIGNSSSTGGSNTGNNSTPNYSGTNNNHPNNANMNLGSSGGGALTPRNLFPEFRYGREEMLSLFDKNCNMPDILPLYKKICVEKVQIPLALTPSTEDEISQNSQAPTQRPLWMQRSPLGFSSSTRGISRGGSVDRGRMRGKPMYTTFQRSPAVFEEEARVGLLKPERSWYERNGSGDTSVGNASSGGNSGIGSGSDWNGGTPHTSPRREFSNHSRNMENWRRNRNDDGAGEPSTEGWRNSISSHSFGGVQRWGRSTSWRDEEGVPPNEVQGPSTNTSNTIQRSFSNISTTLTSGNSTQKKSNGKHFVKMGTGSGSIATSSSEPSKSNKNNQWAATENHTRLHEGEDNLPEWATDIPLEGGGSFDASGAFLGSSGDVERGGEPSNFINQEKTNKEESEDLTLQVSSEAAPEAINHLDEHPRENRYSQNETVTERNEIVKKATKEMSADVSVSETLPNSLDSEKMKMSSASTMVEPISSVSNTQVPQSIQLTGQQTGQRRLSDHMIEAADDMVKKLINDDDTCDIEKPDNNSMKTVSSLEQSLLSIASQNTSHHVINRTNNTVGNVGPVSKGMFFYGNMEQPPAPIQPQPPIQPQLQHQQHQFHPANLIHNDVSAIPTPHAVNELWFYRDPQSKVQGPFAALEMTEWYRAGYFNENLLVRRACDTHFRALGDLIKTCQNNMPFTHSSLLGCINLEAITMIQPQTPKEQCDELKGNVTAAADTLSAAVKNMSSVDMLHMLNVHFQLLQEQYTRRQEMAILSELAKNEAFHRLSPAEREALVRQKAQINGLPDYLTSLTNLGNTLVTLNPSAGTQLFNAILECSKKDNQQPIFPQSQSSALPQNYMDVGEFISSMQRQQQLLRHHHTHTHQSQQQPHPLTQTPMQFSGFDGSGVVPESLLGNGMLEDLNIRLLLGGGNNVHPHPQPPIVQHIPSKSTPQELVTNTHAGGFITEQQILALNGAGVSNTAQSPLMQMWLPSNASNLLGGTQQSPQMQISEQPQSQWASRGSLVGIPSVMNTESSAGEQLDVPPPPRTHAPPSMWTNIHNESQQNSSDVVSGVEEEQIRVGEEEIPPFDSRNDNGSPSASASQNLENDLQAISTKSNANDENNQEKQVQQANAIKKQRQNPSVITPTAGISHQKIKDDFKKVDSEEKRRQKEERKRQLMEEEKKRMQQLEQDRRRQLQEEEDRQKQIQAQRRKALLGSATANGNGNTSTAQKGFKETKVQSSSVAPWSAQSTTTSSASSPCFAEIQKAERRERRADQQRQIELHEKQARINTAAALEANEAVPKWNASPIQAKSIAEIQAEEAKKLNSEALFEAQRRKELELQSALNLASANSSSIGNVLASSTWNTVAQNKFWGGANTGNNSSISTGFWDQEPTAAVAAKNKTSGSGAGSFAAAIASGKQQNNGLQKQQQASPSAVAVSSSSSASRNLKKSQTVSVMQSTPNSAGGGVTKSSKGASQNTNTAPSRQNNNKGATAEKKVVSNSKNNSGSNNPSSSKDEFENEFVNWCMKSLNNMNTKVDVPTFVTFLRDLESPYEVKDYVRIYLGESKEFNDFAKQFLERRSKYKNLQRAQNAHNDDMCKPAPAITPSAGNDNLESKNKQKKLKKNKMTKLDARILGFSVTAAEGRINVGDRDYVDAP